MKQKLATLFLMAFIPTVMMAYDSIVDGIYYDLDTSAKTAEVTFDYLDIEDGYYPSYSGSVTIPSSIVVGGTTYTVTSIGDYAFYCSRTYINEEENIYIGLTSITIPSTVTRIGYAAFGGCFSLTSIDIPSSVTSIGNRAFYNCSGLTSINIPSRVTSIGNYAFYGCTGLTSINIPNSVTSIEDYAFEYCTNLTSITIPSRVTNIGYNAFFGCSNLISVTIPSSVTSIGHNAFQNCSNLASVTIENQNPLRIESSTFSNRTNATLYVPAGSLAAYQEAVYWQEFNHIEEFITFSSSNVKSICLANWDTNSDGKLSISEAEAVTSLGSVFKNNTNISTFNELQYFKGLTSIDSYAFSGCSGLKSVIIPNSVETIGSYAFESCYNLTNVDIPNSVKRIEDHAFYDCDMLTSITIPSSVTAIGWSVFGGFQGHGSIPNIYISDLEAWCNIAFDQLAGFGYYLYLNGEKVDDLIIPNTITKIGAYAFRQSHITSVEIPNSVTSIGAGAFEGCPLTSVTIPNSVTKINKGTFKDCSSLTSVTLPSSVTTIGDEAFENCSQLSSVSIPNSVTTIGKYAFYGCNRLMNITVGNSVTDIGESAFVTGCVENGLMMTVGMESPVNVVYGSIDALPNNIAYGTLYVPVGCKAAYESAEGWKKFRTIMELEPLSPVIDFADVAVKAICVANWDTDGDGELSMDEAAAVTDLGTVFKENGEITSFDELQYFTGLTSLVGAFETCISLKSIVIPSGVETINGYGFTNCTALESIQVDEQNTHFDSRNGCNAIIETATNTLVVGCQNTIIPNDVTAIGYDAFWGRWGMESMSIPSAVTSIGGNAFAFCIALKQITLPSSISNIDGQAFWNCTGLTSVTVEWQEPLTVPENIFAEVDLENVILYVPEGTKAAYKSADVWKEFGKFVEYTALVYNGSMDEQPSDEWSSFWMRDWTNPEELFFGPAKIVIDPTDANNRCAKVVVRSEAQADAAGNKSVEDGDFACWDSQFFIQSREKIESGKRLKLTMRVRADKSTEISTQAHQAPGEYNHWTVFGDINITDTWQTVEREVVITPDMTQEENGREMRTVAFNLATLPESNVFYFDDVRLDVMNPDEVNILYADESERPREIYQGKSVPVSLHLDNETTLTNFQFILELEGGFSLKKVKGKFDCVLNSDRTDGHTLTVTELSEGVYKFLCSNTKDKPFKGDIGELLSITIACEQDVIPGITQAAIRDIKFLDKHNEYVLLDDCTFDIGINILTLGDVNENGDIDVQDLQLMGKHMLDKPKEQTFNFASADIDDNGIINVMDIVDEIDLIMSQPTSPEPDDQVYDVVGSGLSLVTGSNGAFHLRLSDGIQYVASQFVVSLSDGQRLTGVTTDRGHTICYQPLSDNRYLVVCYSMDNREFADSDHALTLLVTGRGNVSVEDASFVNTRDQKVAFQNVNSEFTTGISETEAGGQKPADIYSTGGVVVRKDATSTEGLPSGVYIVKGKKYSKK